MQLVILAAGMGSRFGGLKQMEPMDEANNFLLDYSIHDAKKAGFDSVVFIIKKDFFKEFKESIGKRVEKIINVLKVLNVLKEEKNHGVLHMRFMQHATSSMTTSSLSMVMTSTDKKHIKSPMNT